MSTPQDILKILRQRHDLDENDKSHDEEFRNMGPMEKLREVTAWELGDPTWADQLLTWAIQCGIELKDPR